MFLIYKNDKKCSKKLKFRIFVWRKKEGEFILLFLIKLQHLESNLILRRKEI